MVLLIFFLCLLTGRPLSYSVAKFFFFFFCQVPFFLDISAILDMYEMAECENACSWTSNYVPYYHHTINRARVFFNFDLFSCFSLFPSFNL